MIEEDMKCPKCNAAITLGQRFCGACGAPIAEYEVPLHEVNLRWIASVFSAGGVQVDFVRDHLQVKAGRYTIAVSFIPSPAIVTLEMLWTITKAGVFNRREFTDSINSANAQSSIVGFQYSNDLSKVAVSMGIPLFPTVSAVALLHLMNVFETTAYQAAESANLFKFA